MERWISAIRHVTVTISGLMQATMSPDILHREALRMLEARGASHFLRVDRRPDTDAVYYTGVMEIPGSLVKMLAAQDLVD